MGSSWRNVKKYDKLVIFAGLMLKQGQIQGGGGGGVGGQDHFGGPPNFMKKVPKKLRLHANMQHFST